MKSTAQLARDPQAQLPTGPTHVAFRATRTQRTAEQVIESNSAFLVGRLAVWSLADYEGDGCVIGWMALCLLRVPRHGPGRTDVLRHRWST